MSVMMTYHHVIRVFSAPQNLEHENQLGIAKEKLVHGGQDDNKDDHLHKWRTDALGNHSCRNLEFFQAGHRLFTEKAAGRSSEMGNTQRCF